MFTRFISWLNPPVKSLPKLSEKVIRSCVAPRFVARYADSGVQTDSNMLSRTVAEIETEPLEFSLDEFGTEREEPTVPSRPEPGWHARSRGPVSYGFQGSGTMSFSLNLKDKQPESTQKQVSSIFVFKTEGDDARRAMFGLAKECV